VSTSVPPPPGHASYPPPGGERGSLPPPPGERLASGAMTAYARPPEKSFLERRIEQSQSFLDGLGTIAFLVGRTMRTLIARPLEWRAVVYQMEVIGVASVGIASITALFIGMVMAIQFADGLQKFGGIEYVGRVMGLSFAKELAPTLTAVIVGGRVGAGMAAEVGSMQVTEQVDAIRALGADPVKKLVMPRIVASTLVMPILSFFALALGFGGGMVVIHLQFDMSMQFFFRSALESVGMRDLAAGMAKCPFFGFIIGVLGCHFGLKTRGGTEGVGRSTTSTVVAVSIAILVADFFLTKLFLRIF
jgi:phospholipid/cholesterol/gamma-HCH transport system permease protein